MSWSEMARACWELYPLDVLTLAVMIPLCAILLTFCVYALVWHDDD